MPKSTSPIYERPAELLQNLIRFDTTNPSGNERPCIQYINGLLKETGIKTNIVARTPGRPNVIARLKGEGKAPPLLLYGHVDVVTTAGQKWTHPPFEGKIVDGYIWGRGALDMKSGIVMLLSAFLKAKAEKSPCLGMCSLRPSPMRKPGTTSASVTWWMSTRTCSKACTTPSASSAASTFP